MSFLKWNGSRFLPLNRWLFIFNGGTIPARDERTDFFRVLLCVLFGKFSCCSVLCSTEQNRTVQICRTCSVLFHPWFRPHTSKMAFATFYLPVQKPHWRYHCTFKWFLWISKYRRSFSHGYKRVLKNCRKTTFWIFTRATSSKKICEFGWSTDSRDSIVFDKDEF